MTWLICVCVYVCMQACVPACVCVCVFLKHGCLLCHETSNLNKRFPNSVYYVLLHSATNGLSIMSTGYCIDVGEHCPELGYRRTSVCKFNWYGAGPPSVVGSNSDCKSRGHWFEPRSCHILSLRFAHENISKTILTLPLIQEGQVSVTGERMGTKYW